MGIRFTPRELDLMAVLWERGPATAAEVRARLAEDGLTLAYNTVQTVLRILEEKGYVSHVDEGRAHRFQASVGRAAAGQSAIDRVVDTLFGGSVGLLATELVSRRMLDRTELRELRELVNRELDSAKTGTPRIRRPRSREETP